MAIGKLTSALLPPSEFNLYSPSELERQNQQLMAQARTQAQQMGPGQYMQNIPGVAFSPPAAILEVRDPARRKLERCIERCIDQLPWAVAVQIAMITYGPAGAMEPCFEVVYVNGRRVQFYSVDTFPTEADISRICLDCP